MQANCATCEIPIDTRKRYPLCSPCVIYLNSLSNEEFGQVAVRVFGKSQEEVTAWLKEPQDPANQGDEV